MNNKRNAVIAALFEKKNKRKPKNSQELQDFVQSQGGEEFLKKVDEYIAQAEKDQAQKAQKAAHGAKLQYFRKLKNKCAEDEELVYYKKGGKVECGCEKKQKGGNVPPKKQSAVDKFKAKRRTKEEQAKIDKQSQEDYENGTYGMSKEEIEQFNNPNKQKKTPIKKIKPATPRHEAGGKAMPKGPFVKGKVCPKCGKIHAAGMGCHLSKIKVSCGGSKLKKHQQGGSLNGIPFMQKGTPKGGLPTAPKAEDRYKGGTKEITIVHPYDVTKFGFRGTQPIRKVNSGSASISEIIRDAKDGTPADTMYYEIPNHLPFVNVQPRYSFSYGNLSSKYGFNPEFNILKRRFNTAWNLAK